jgi:hypothetical protein
MGTCRRGRVLPTGGCINSHGSVFLTRSTVKDCTASGADAFGGGAYATHGVVILDSVVSGNRALGSINDFGRGGGIYSTSLTALHSEFLGNATSGFGGAADIRSMASGYYISIYDSSLAGNSAGKCAAASLQSPGISVSNSTISGNSVPAVGDPTFGNGGLCVYGTSVNVSNSTIAFNHADYGSGGLFAQNVGTLTLQSSIIAQNGSRDLQVPFATMVDGANNLVMHADGNIPAGVIVSQSDPMLDPQIRFNGGLTRTHALLPGSPAIGAGNNNAGLWNDQRGRGYPRTTGPGYLTDIGAFQFDSIFFDDFDG